MATTPVPTPQPYSALHPISVYLKAHEHLLIVLVLVLAGWFSVGKVENIIAAHDNANLQQAKVAAQVQQSKDAALAAQVASQAAQYQALADKVQVQNAALVAANTQLATALAKQQKTDATLPPSDLVARWNMLVLQAGAAVTPNGVTLLEAGAVATVQQLEQVPVLTTQLKAAEEVAQNDELLVRSGQAQVTTLTQEVGGLRLQIVDNQKVCQDQIAVVKAAARKSKRRWFIAGVIVGWVGRQLVKTETGF